MIYWMSLADGFDFAGVDFLDGKVIVVTYGKSRLHQQLTLTVVQGIVFFDGPESIINLSQHIIAQYLR
jgi:hypothetical protein